MRFDLQDVWRRNPKAFIVGAVVILAAFAALVVKGAVSSSSHKTHTPTVAAKTTTSTNPTKTGSTEQDGVTVPSASYHPAYTTVPSTPADQKLAEDEEASGADIAKLEGITPPAPEWSRDYPSIPPSVWHQEQGYVMAFVTELLDRNYRDQSRSDLGRWLSAESASDVLPGVPSAAGNHQLFAEMMEPGRIGFGTSPVPTAAQWAAGGRSDERQHVFGIFVNPNAAWAKEAANGVTTKDPLVDVQDVTGELTTTMGGEKATTQHFSMELFVGSALHHPGYGAWAFDEWSVH